MRGEAQTIHIPPPPVTVTLGAETVPIAEARRGIHLLGRGFSRLLADLQTRVAGTTEPVERVENSLKVTGDVFLARICAAAGGTPAPQTPEAASPEGRRLAGVKWYPERTTPCGRSPPAGPWGPA